MPVEKNLKLIAYSRICEMMAGGELPPGSRLSNRALAQEMGISPIPVREAISHLQSEGLVDHRHGEGAFVPVPNSDELLDLYDQREALECHAIERICASVSNAVLDEIKRCINEFTDIVGKVERVGRSAWNADTISRWSMIDIAFHDAILCAAGNRRTLNTCRKLRFASRIFGKYVAHEDIANLRQTLTEHRRILNALQRGDADEARAATAEHIRNGCNRVLDFYRRRRTNQNHSPEFA